MLYYVKYDCDGCGMFHDVPDLTYDTRSEAHEHGAYCAGIHECDDSDVHITIKRLE